jgi:uncharacterized protein YecE (DUF72 family)
MNKIPSYQQIQEKYKSYLRIGTCSWKYDSWKGLVYDQEKKYKANDYLADYARYFNTVEIDQWFWSLFPKGAKLPDSETVRRYTDSVPDDFLFTVKAPNSITLEQFKKRYNRMIQTILLHHWQLQHQVPWQLHLSVLALSWLSKFLEPVSKPDLYEI